MTHVDQGSGWYVVHTHAHAEETASRNLEQQGFSTFLPQFRKRRRHARRTDYVRAALFPRYLFVEMNLGLARWRAVSSTIGVTHLICNGDRPAPVPRTVIDEIRTRTDENGLVSVKPKAPFLPGETVRVTGGALADSFGLFQCLNDEDRVIVLLDLLGRQLKIEVPLESVAAIA